MAFEVIITSRAVLDIDEYTLFIAQDSPAEAGKWQAALQSLVLGLDEMPDRFHVIPEAAELGLPYRSFNHHSHRVIFRIDELANTVYVVRVYHHARRPLSSKDLRDR